MLWFPSRAPHPLSRDALEVMGLQRRPQKRLAPRLDRRLEEVAKAVGSGYCRLQMPLNAALAVRGTVAGHRLGALEGGGGWHKASVSDLEGEGLPPPLLLHPCPPPPSPSNSAPKVGSPGGRSSRREGRGRGRSGGMCRSGVMPPF